ncbi:universal stress protein UspA [Nonomuraea sp. WAC 01424]|uniref:universal stress protein n=1 Tax=Nonomuraea sp. WAC 01424 TaxID=2203200 RepID=UPI000F799BBB|nr:universal stress protein [Nonomuraea sp. WAC 01424]RSN04807.1 universal stress protein UspA [Nonomuraea sp. WAC 01424]
MSTHIVVGVDGSAPATEAVEWAAADARRRGLDLRIVHVCPEWWHGENVEHCARALEAAAERARERAGDVKVTTELLTGNVVEELIRESATADSVVLGSRGLGGFAGMVVGSVSVGVAGHAAGPVVVVRTAATAGHATVVVGYDGSDDARAAMEYAVEQARSRGARLHVVSAWQVPVFSPYAVAYNSLIEEAVRQAREAAHECVVPWRAANPDLVITDEQPCAHPVSALIQAAGSADLVVVGSRGRGGFAAAVLGSVSQGVLHHVTCPVAVVRPRTEERS